MLERTYYNLSVKIEQFVGILHDKYNFEIDNWNESLHMIDLRLRLWYPNLSEVIIYSRMYLKVLLSLQKRSLLEIGNARRMQTLKTQFCKRTNSLELLLLKYTHSLIMKRN